MRWLFWMSVVGYAVAVFVVALALPDRVPLHFGGGGEPDRWGSRTEAVVTFAAIGAGLAVLLGGTAALIGRVDLRSAWVNVPHKEWWTATPEREARARRMISADVYGIAASTMVFLSAMVLLTLRAARLREPQLDLVFAVVLGVWLVGVLGYTLWMMLVRYRPRTD